MNFDFYDIFTKVIPGGLIILVVVLCGFYVPNPNVKIPDLAYLFASYIVGFIVDAIASSTIIRKILWFLFGGKTSDVLLKGKQFNGNKYKFINILKDNLGDNWDDRNLDKTFDYIYRQSLGAKRVQGFNNHWINTRNLLVSFIISSTMLEWHIWDTDNELKVKIFLSILLLYCVLVLFFRAKSRQYLFVKEVLDSFVFSKKES